MRITDGRIKLKWEIALVYNAYLSKLLVSCSLTLHTVPLVKMIPFEIIINLIPRWLGRRIKMQCDVAMR